MKMTKWRRFVRWFKARFHLDEKIVCEMSEGLGTHDDYHTYEDDTRAMPWDHMIPLCCSRCGKQFYI